MDFNQLILLNNLAKKAGESSVERRDLFKSLYKHNDRTFVGLLGPRGVGKTILLKQLLATSNDGFYISLDSLDEGTDLFELIQQLHEVYKFNTFYLDEVHYFADINKALKLIFDNLKIKLFFTSSIALKLIESAYDLSRRVKIFNIPPFSFLEYLKFNHYPVASILSWHDIVAGNYSAQHTTSYPYFQRFLSGGNYPFSLEVTDIQSALKSNLEKIIYFDIPKLKSLTTQELPLIMKAFKFITRSPASDVNPNVISSNLKITRYKAEQYVKLLESAFVLKQIFPSGTNVTKEPKILCGLPFRLLESTYQDSIGGLREDFAISCLVEAGLHVEYLKNSRGMKTPDFLASDGNIEVVIEVGGAGKGTSQFKGVTKKYRKIILSDTADVGKNSLPLILLGFLGRN